MICPACHADITDHLFWVHLESCGVETGGIGKVVCACGAIMRDTSREPFIEHLSMKHDWPKVLTRSAMENM